MTSDTRLKKPFGTFASIVSHVGMILVAALFLFPFFWMLSNAVRPKDEIFTSPPQLWPSEVQWDNFAFTWLNLPFGQFFINSAFVAGAITLITLLVSTLAGYAFARIQFAGRNGLFVVYLATLMVPQTVVVIPLFLLMTWLGWTNTYHGMILPMAFSSFGTFMMRQFFLTIPRELEDAAIIDGASRLRILFSIFVPLSVPALGLLALFTFTGQWNSFLWPLIVVSDPDLATIPLGLTIFRAQEGDEWNYLMAGAAISMVPGIVMTVLLQRFIFKGMAITSGFGGR